MGRGNVATVQVIYAAFRSREMAAVFSRVTEDFTITQSTGVPWGGVYRGHEGFAIFMGKLFAHVTGQMEFREFVKTDEAVAAIGRTTGTLLASGGTFDLPFVHVWHFRAERAARLEIYVDEQEIMALGGNG